MDKVWVLISKESKNILKWKSNKMEKVSMFIISKKYILVIKIAPEIFIIVVKTQIWLWGGLDSVCNLISMSYEK